MPAWHGEVVQSRGSCKLQYKFIIMRRHGRVKTKIKLLRFRKCYSINPEKTLHPSAFNAIIMLKSWKNPRPSPFPNHANGHALYALHKLSWVLPCYWQRFSQLSRLV